MLNLLFTLLQCLLKIIYFLLFVYWVVDIFLKPQTLTDLACFFPTLISIFKCHSTRVRNTVQESTQIPCFITWKYSILIVDFGKAWVCTYKFRVITAEFCFIKPVNKYICILISFHSVMITLPWISIGVWVKKKKAHQSNFFNIIYCGFGKREWGCFDNKMCGISCWLKFWFAY